MVRNSWGEDIIGHIEDSHQEKHHKCHDVSEGDPDVQGESLHQEVVQQKRNECCDNVSKAHVKHNGGGRVLGLVVVYGCDEAVVGKEEASATEDQSQVDATAPVFTHSVILRVMRGASMAAMFGSSAVLPGVKVSSTDILIHFC